MLSLATTPGFGFPVTYTKQEADSGLIPSAPGKTVVSNDISYIGQETDMKATPTQLPNGCKGVFLTRTVGRGTEGKYTHSAICISFFESLKGINAEEINAIINGKGIGIVNIVDNKIKNLRICSDTIDKLNKFDVKEILLLVGTQLRTLDPMAIVPFQSNEQYEQFCSMKVIPMLKNKGVV